MNDRTLKMIFLLAFLGSFCSIVCHHSVYPTIRFPHFKNRSLGSEFTYSEVRVYSAERKQEVNLMSVIKPYDKQYYFFIQKALADDKTSVRALGLLNRLYRQECCPTDSLNFTVHSFSTSVE